MSRSLFVVLLLTASGRAGAAGGGASVDAKPETRLAAVIQQFQRSADELASSRRQVVRARQSVVDQTDEETTRARAVVDQEKALWALVGEKDKAAFLEGIIQATNAVGKSLEAQRALSEQRSADLAKLESKVSFHQEKLTAVAKALTALGSNDALPDLIAFYVGYVAQTRSEIDALQRTAASPGASPVTPAASTGGRSTGGGT
jgi:hypothetical protein